MLIVSHPTNQLGNCLRSILSTKILADSLGADFAIDLSKLRYSQHAAPILHTVFQDRILTGPAAANIEELHETSVMRFRKVYGTNSSADIEAVFNPKDSFPNQGFSLLHIYSAKPHRMAAKDYLSRKRREYRTMPFPAPLQDAAVRFSQTHGLKDAAGMHIRYTDNLMDPSKATLNTSLKAFETRLKAILRKGQRALLCTDNEKVQEFLCARYARHLILPDAVNPIFQGLYEMMLLAETDYVVGSYSSTFAYEACLFKGTDLELLEDGAWKRYPFSSFRDA